jgi:hypothetical protein
MTIGGVDVGRASVKNDKLRIQAPIMMFHKPTSRVSANPTCLFRIQ